MSELMEKIKERVAEASYPVFTLALLGDGIDECETFIRTNRCQDSYSVAKAFAVTAFGLAYDDGLIAPGDRVAKLLGKYMPAGTDPRWNEITYDDVMLHKLGLPRGFLDIDVAPAGKFGSDYLGYLFSEPFETEPRVERCYTDAAYYLISRAVEEACGEPIDTLLWRRLFLPMNYAEVAWSRCPQGHPMGATGLYIRSRDMVKLGELYRCGGIFAGRRLISEDWIGQVLSRGYELRPTGIGPSYAKGGMYGQELCVFPDRGFSVAWHAFGFKEKDSLVEFIYNNSR